MAALSVDPSKFVPEDKACQTVIHVSPFILDECYNFGLVSSFKSCQTALNFDKDEDIQNFISALKYVPYNSITEDCIKVIDLPRKVHLQFPKEIDKHSPIFFAAKALTLSDDDFMSEFCMDLIRCRDYPSAKRKRVDADVQTEYMVRPHILETDQKYFNDENVELCPAVELCVAAENVEQVEETDHIQQAEEVQELEVIQQSEPVEETNETAELERSEKVEESNEIAEPERGEMVEETNETTEPERSERIEETNETVESGRSERVEETNETVEPERSERVEETNETVEPGRSEKVEETKNFLKIQEDVKPGSKTCRAAHRCSKISDTFRPQSSQGNQVSSNNNLLQDKPLQNDQQLQKDTNIQVSEESQINEEKISLKENIEEENLQETHENAVSETDQANIAPQQSNVVAADNSETN